MCRNSLVNRPFFGTRLSAKLLICVEQGRRVCYLQLHKKRFCAWPNFERHVFLNWRMGHLVFVVVSFDRSNQFLELYFKTYSKI